jgi:hypothetical protein
MGNESSKYGSQPFQDIKLSDHVVIACVSNSLGEAFASLVQNITQILRKDSKAYTIDSSDEACIHQPQADQKNQ